MSNSRVDTEQGIAKGKQAIQAWCDSIYRKVEVKSLKDITFEDVYLTELAVSVDLMVRSSELPTEWAKRIIGQNSLGTPDLSGLNFAVVELFKMGGYVQILSKGDMVLSLGRTSEGFKKNPTSKPVYLSARGMKLIERLSHFDSGFTTLEVSQGGKALMIKSSTFSNIDFARGIGKLSDLTNGIHDVLKNIRSGVSFADRFSALAILGMELEVENKSVSTNTSTDAVIRSKRKLLDVHSPGDHVYDVRLMDMAYKINLSQTGATYVNGSYLFDSGVSVENNTVKEMEQRAKFLGRGTVALFITEQYDKRSFSVKTDYQNLIPLV